MDEWIKRMFYMFTIEYYCYINKMKSCHVPQHGWVELEGVRLSEISQIGKDKYHMISLIHGKNSNEHNK